MPISREHKLIFVHIPKCAGSTIEKMLNVGTIDELYSDKPMKNTPLYLDESVIPFEDIQYMGCKTPQHLTYRELVKLLPDNIINEFKFFSVVRNPYSRIVSELNFVKKTHGLAKFNTSSLKDFLQYLTLPKFDRIKNFDGHLETQSSYLIDHTGKISDDVAIYKFEELPSNLDWLLKLTGDMSIPHERKSIDSTPYQEYYDSECQEIVYNFYKNDFVNFGYNKDL